MILRKTQHPLYLHPSSTDSITWVRFTLYVELWCKLQGDPNKLFHTDVYLKYVSKVLFLFSICVLEWKFWARFFSIPWWYPFRILKSSKTQDNNALFLLNKWIFDYSRLSSEKIVCQRIVFCTFEAFKMLLELGLGTWTFGTDLSPQSWWDIFLGSPWNSTW